MTIRTSPILLNSVKKIKWQDQELNLSGNGNEILRLCILRPPTIGYILMIHNMYCDTMTCTCLLFLCYQSKHLSFPDSLKDGHRPISLFLHENQSIDRRKVLVNKKFDQINHQDSFKGAKTTSPNSYAFCGKWE